MQTGKTDETRSRIFEAPAPMPVYDFFKRIFDLVVASVALIVLSPLFLVTAIAIRAEGRGPVIFSQVRLTKNAKPFKMFKFRSMCVDAEARKKELQDQNEMQGPVFKIADDPRITKVGRFIRRTSIDELPQLVNILMGDMTVIGPRPPLPDEVAQYDEYQMHRLDVKTGLACYHECLGRSDSDSFDAWVEQDLKYIRERGMLTDIKILLLMVKAVLSGRGAV
jgi:lipopolysaccharide/colanic/teichoic acid biosynthesis glycosyltransferase